MILFLFFSISFSQLIIPTIEIADGVNMPLVGLGSWLYDSDTAYASTLSALKLGYTHFDTAYDYRSEDGVANSIGIGKALEEMKEKRPRDSYFITTKIEGGLNFTRTVAEHMENLKDLGLNHVDLLLTHFPCTMEATPVCSKACRQDQWRALETLLMQGATRAIGTSHFCKKHMQDILEIATVKPAVNQVEYHVGMGSSGPLADDDKDWMQSQGIHFQGFSPLCGPCANGTELITGKMVTDIGKKYNKTGAQVSLRWQVQQNIPVIPKTSNPSHQLQNAQLFDFELSDDDMETLTMARSPAAAGGGGTGPSGDCQFD